ncbi:MAG TPA: hypothetical protein VGR88_02290, partial [Ktedonobacterales bacterium]|nr:hypothetical protein [Ktedonobacterales bacterium]
RASGEGTFFLAREPLLMSEKPGRMRAGAAHYVTKRARCHKDARVLKSRPETALFYGKRHKTLPPARQARLHTAKRRAVGAQR